TIFIAAVNDAPVANDDKYITPVDAPLNVAKAGVLANDTDVDGDTLTAAVVANPTHGGLTLNPDGSFAYTPDKGFNGSDTFTYKANDGTVDGNTATVTIHVNTAPAATDDSYNATEDTDLVVDAGTGVLGNDTDADTNPLTAVVVAQPGHGVVTLN